MVSFIDDLSPLNANSLWNLLQVIEAEDSMFFADAGGSETHQFLVSVLRCIKGKDRVELASCGKHVIDYQLQDSCYVANGACILVDACISENDWLSAYKLIAIGLRNGREKGFQRAVHSEKSYAQRSGGFHSLGKKNDGETWEHWLSRAM